MKCKALSQNNVQYVVVTSGQITAEQDAIDLISACGEFETDRLFLPFECLSDDFLDLSTRVAGLFLQKLTNYYIKTAAVIDPARLSERYREFSYESAKGKMFRIFESNEDAVEWLTA